MYPRRRPSPFPLNALRAFDAAARLGSFKAAAQELSVTPAAISHQVKALESQVGAQLFTRLHQSLRLTKAGARLAAATQEAFAGLHNALHELSDDGLTTGPATLTISAASSLAARWLAPRLHRFQTAHRQTELRLMADDRLIDLERDPSVDVTLRYGPGPYASMLRTERMWPAGEVYAVCTPDYAAERRISTPRQLVRQTLLRTSSPVRPENHRGLTWLDWFQAAGLDTPEAQVAATAGPLFGSTQLALEAAFSGQGIVLAPDVLVRPDILSGRLQKLFDITVRNPFSYWLICRQDRAEEARIRSFLSWVMQEARDTQQAIAN